jgi:hypothetical protein
MSAGILFEKAGSAMMSWAGKILDSADNYSQGTRHGKIDKNGRNNNYEPADDVVIFGGYAVAAVCLFTATPVGYVARQIGRNLQKFSYS